MSNRVLCLRPEADFLRVGVMPPATLAVHYAQPNDPALADLMKAADALVIPAVGPPLAAALFEGTGIRLVQVTGAGLDRLDEAEMRRLGIPVANVPGGSNEAVAEYVIAAALVLLRRLAFAHREIGQGRYARVRAAMLAEVPTGLTGITAGVIGLGTIGFAVAEALAKLGAHIVYFDPKPRDRHLAERSGFVSLPLTELLETADVVTLHTPLLAQTRGLIGSAELARMKRSAILINAARGGIVDEGALAEALRGGRLAGAAVDVYETEPPPADHPLLKLDGAGADRLLLTPHIAGVTRQASAKLFGAAWDNVERVLIAGRPPLHRAF
ncbi:MAG TPA: NAD(P)-dependent oxidoreductase [Hyphomicrobiaceae bacterium]|nr:NAD(P)-dependent oxidoreductase [Hyphomicrobiaceae bacterium]